MEGLKNLELVTTVILQYVLSNEPKKNSYGQQLVIPSIVVIQGVSTRQVQ